MRVTDVLPEHIEHYLAQRNVSPNTKDANCRAISSFFTWCMKGKRHWCVNNPCYAVEIEDDRWLGKVFKGKYFFDVIFASSNGTMPIGDQWFENAQQIEVFGYRRIH